jgi:hypothetical protein
VPDLVLPNEGIGELLTYLLSAPIPGVLPWRCVLFVTDIVPVAGTVAADLEQPTFPGYAPVNLTRSEWSTPIVSDGCARSTWGSSPVQWDNEGSEPVTVYGYALLDMTTGVIRGVQRFDDDDIAALAPGETLQINPLFTLTSAACGA